MDSPQNQKKEITSVKKDLLDLIHNKVFLGRYVERRYVESLQAYRDIIVVESKEEIASKLMLSKKISETFANNQWIGISNDPQNIDSDDILLWVQLNNVTIGKHWFLLSDIKFESREIILETQYVQPYRSPDRTFNTSDTEFPSFDIKEIMTYKNMCEVLKFSAIVVMALFTFAIEVLRYLGEYSIKLSYVIVSLIHVSTPICLGMFDFFTKCVGGFLWLIYVMFKGTPNTPAVPAALLNSNQRQLGYQRSIQYKYGVTHYPSQSYSPEIYRQCHSPEIYRQSYSPEMYKQSYSPEMYKQSYSPERDDWAECRKRHDSDNFM